MLESSGGGEEGREGKKDANEKRARRKELPEQLGKKGVTRGLNKKQTLNSSGTQKGLDRKWAILA